MYTFLLFTGLIAFNVAASAATITLPTVHFSGTSEQTQVIYFYGESDLHSGGTFLSFDIKGDSGFHLYGNPNMPLSDPNTFYFSGLGCDVHCSLTRFDIFVTHDRLPTQLMKASAFTLGTSGQVDVATDNGDIYVIPLAVPYVYHSSTASSEQTTPYNHSFTRTDNYLFTNTPEPTTLSLTGVGVLAAVWSRRYRHRIPTGSIG